MTTNKLFNIIGLQRNGCHAVTNWLLKQNEHMIETDLVKDTPTEQSHGDLYHIKTDEYNYYLWNQFWFKNQEPHAPDSLVKSDGDIENGAIVYEVGQINRFNTDFNNKSEIFGDIKYEYNIIVLRDFCNMAASFYQIHHELPEHIALFWYHRILEITNKTHFIPNKYYISYNEWFIDKVYRQKIAKDLQLTFTDYGLNDVLDFGKGSSFDKRTRHKQGQTMNVNRRWKQLLGNAEFIRILAQHKQLVQVSKQIFGAQYGP